MGDFNLKGTDWETGTTMQNYDSVAFRHVDRLILMDGSNTDESLHDLERWLKAQFVRHNYNK